MRFLLLSLTTALLIAPNAANAQSGASPADLARDDANMSQCLEAVRNMNEGGANNGDMHDCIGIIATPCMETPDGSSTIGMSFCTRRETDWWDKQLNSSYQQLKNIMNQQDFTQLRDLQRKWIAYKDAKCEFEHASWKGGTIASVASAQCFLDTTADQAITLSGHLRKSW